MFDQAIALLEQAAVEAHNRSNSATDPDKQADYHNQAVEYEEAVEVLRKNDPWPRPQPLTE